MKLCILARHPIYSIFSILYYIEYIVTHIGHFSINLYCNINSKPDSVYTLAYSSQDNCNTKCVNRENWVPSSYYV